MINKYLNFLHEMNLPDDSYPIKKLLPSNSILCLLYSDKPIKKIDKSVRLIIALMWKGTSWVSYGEMVQEEPGTFKGADNLHSHLDELGDIIPNLEDEDRSKFLNCIKQKKSFSNIESFSMEQVNHDKAYVSMFSFSQLKKVLIAETNKYREDIYHMEISKHFVKPLFPFKTIKNVALNDYDSMMTFKG